MNGQSELRLGLIPSGNCIPDESGDSLPELFSEIDNGRSDERMLVLAQEACKTCIQLDYCTSQVSDIATELWERGAGLSVIGGTHISVASVERPIDSERAVLTFDLTTIPKEPEHAVAIIRQGFRSRQFNTAGPTPKGVTIASEAYLERLMSARPDLHAKLTAMAPSEVTQGLTYVLTALFQQKDFANYAAGKTQQSRKGNPRYRAELITSDDDPIISRFLEDTIKIQEMGFSKAAAKAAHFEPDFYTKLAKDKPETMSWSDFDRAIGSNRSPIGAMLRHSALTSRYQSAEDDASRATVRARVRRGDKEHITAERLRAIEIAYQKVDYVTPALIRSIANTNVANPEQAVNDLVGRVLHLQRIYSVDHPIVRTSDMVRFASSYRSTEKVEEAVRLFEQNMTGLTKKYKDDPTITPSDIRRFSTAHLHDAFGAAKAYKDRLHTLEQTADSAISPSILRQCARRGITSPIEASRVYNRRVVHDRFTFRAKKDSEAQPLKPELIERIVCLYPQAEINNVSEQAFRLLNQGHLVFTRAETYALRGSTPEALDKIFSPKTQEYLTFSATLRDLSPAQRLAFAHQHNLVPLLYGREPNTLQFEQAALGGTSLEKYYESTLLPRLQAFNTASDRPQGISTMELGADLAAFDILLGQSAERPLPHDRERLAIHGLRDATVVVGGKALYLHENDYAWDWTEQLPDLRGRLAEKITTAYPPHQHEQATAYIEDALSGGVLEVLGSTPGEYRLVFSPAFYNETVTDVERAAIANAMGIDRLLYGSDLTTILKHRLGDNDHTVQIRRRGQPEIIEFTDDQLAETRRALELEALDIEAQEPLTQFVLTIFGGGYKLDTLSDKQWQTIGDSLLAAYNSYIENPNHRHEIFDPIVKAQVAFAWAEARRTDTTHVARLFGIASNDIDPYIDAGLLFVRDQLLRIPLSRFKEAARILATVAIPEAAPAPSSPVVEPVKSEPIEPVQINTQENMAERDARHIARLSGSIATEKAVIKTDEKSENVDQSSAFDESFTSTIIPFAVESNELKDTVGSYLRGTKKYPLLTAEEEVTLSQAIEAGVFAQEKLDKGVVPSTDLDDYKRLAVIGANAKERMITANLRLVASIAKSYAPTPSMGFTDYIQEGNFGLIRAVEKFDYRKGYKFSTYASRWIHQSIRRGTVLTGETIYLPQEVSDRLRYFLAFVSKFSSENNGRLPEDQIVLQKFGWSQKQLEAVKYAKRQKPTSLSVKVSHRTDDEIEFGGIIEDADAPSPEAESMRDTAREALSAMIRTFVGKNDRQDKAAIATTLLHGLKLHPDIVSADFVRKHKIEEGRAYTANELAAMLGVSRQAISQRLQIMRTLLSAPDSKQRLAYLLGYVDTPNVI